MKKLIMLMTFLGLTLSTSAQSWLGQAKKAILSVVTYDKDGNLLNKGNGFFISTDGVAVSDYKLFSGAAKAEVIDADGQKCEIASVLGANDTYDVIKLKVNTTKKITPLAQASAKAAIGNTVYLLPYSTQKTITPKKTTVKAVDAVAETYKFYTLNMGIEDNLVSTPILNEAGQVIGLAQKGSATESYAMDSQYASQLSISALSANDDALNSIGILKELPEKADEALVYVMMSGNTLENINRLIAKYPDQPEGYMRRATIEVDQKEFAKAEEDLKKFLELSTDKADAHYQISHLIYNFRLYQPDATYSDWDYNKSISEIDQALTINKLPIFTKHKGDVYFAMGDYDKAYNEYQSLIGSDLKAADLYTYMADCKVQQGASNDEIIALMDSAVAQFTKPYPDEAATYLYNRALQKTKAQKYRDAVNDFNDVEHIYGGRASAAFYYNREMAEKNCRMYQQALDDINEALEMAPNDLEIMVEHASLNVILKYYDKSKETAEKIVLQYPEESMGYRLLGFSQAMTGDKAGARKNLQKAKEMGDENAQTILDKYCK